MLCDEIFGNTSRLLNDNYPPKNWTCKTCKTDLTTTCKHAYFISIQLIRYLLTLQQCSINIRKYKNSDAIKWCNSAKLFLTREPIQGTVVWCAAAGYGRPELWPAEL